jgi:hypothetical protein
MRVALTSFLLLACGRPPPVAEPASHPPVEPPVREAPPEPRAEPPNPVILRAEADLDGVAGNETIELHADGALVAGSLRGTVELPQASEFWMDEQAAITVVDLDRAAPTRAVLVALPTDADEDPPNRFQLFVARDGALVRVLDITPGAYHPTELAFPGDGTVHFLEDGWSACERAGHSSRAVAREEITFRLAGDSMIESNRRPTRERQRCDELAACPFVYRIDGEREALAGEILRNLRGRGAYALQELAMSRAAPGPLVIELREEKAEVTFLDEIYVEVDGERIAPRACIGPEAYCTADQRSHVMRRGDVLRVEFDTNGGDAVLFARGYYIPE